MITIAIIIAGIMSGEIIPALCIVAFGWLILIIGIMGAKSDLKNPRPQDPIDKHGDENYGDIDWLRKGKL